MKAEKGSEIITTICEYENSVAMPDNERLTYLDTCGIARLKDGNGNVKAQEAYASRCSEYLRFGHEVDLAACGAYSPYDTPLIAGIKPDGTGNYGEREVETNMVLSVYSRQNFIRYFALLRDMDAFVFVSGRKIEALEDLSGLPLAENCSGLDIDRILQRPKCLG